MKKILFVLILFVSSFSYALHVECVGNAVLLTNEGDTLLVFASKPELKTLNSVGVVHWYQLPDTVTPIQIGTDYLYPEHGEGYAIKINGNWEYFWVFDYEHLRCQITHIEAQATCENTLLTLDGVVPEMAYKNRFGTPTTYPRLCRVTHTNAMWNNELLVWEDSMAIEEMELQHTLTVGASPVLTDYSITDALCDSLGIEADSIVSQLVEPMVVKAAPTTKTATRPSQKSNEVERPIEESALSGSAPLDIEFKANTLNAEFQKWVIYKEQTFVLDRTEAQHRYTFEEPGSYTVKIVASNSKGCATDTMEISVTVSVSMLEVPNVFTPNGDGANDEFRVVYKSLKEFHIWVYNRWGHLVYKSDDPAKGWDGTITGRPAAEGAYYYVIRALGTDAKEGYIAKPKYSKKKKEGEVSPDGQYVGVYQLSGDINLLR